MKRPSMEPQRASMSGGTEGEHDVGQVEVAVEAKPGKRNRANVKEKVQEKEESDTEEVKKKAVKKMYGNRKKGATMGQRKSMRLASKSASKSVKEPVLVNLEREEDGESVNNEVEYLQIPIPEVPLTEGTPPATTTEPTASENSGLMNLVIQLRNSLTDVTASNVQLLTKVSKLGRTVAGLAASLKEYKDQAKQNHEEILHTIKTLRFEEVSADEEEVSASD